MTEQVEKSLFSFCPEAETLLMRRLLILTLLRDGGTTGRRKLADKVYASEREIRSEIQFLREQGWVLVSPRGIHVLPSGVHMIEQMQGILPELYQAVSLQIAVAERFPEKKCSVYLHVYPAGHWISVSALMETELLHDDMKHFLLRRGGLICLQDQVLKADGSVLYTVPGNKKPDDLSGRILVPASFDEMKMLALIRYDASYCLFLSSDQAARLLKYIEMR